MRWAALLLCVVLFAGCRTELTEAQARAACDAAGASDESFDRGVELAEEDEAEGLTAEESLDLFDGDCEDECGADSECFSACFTCATAIVNYVYAD